MESTDNDAGQELDLQQVRERAQQLGFEFDYDWDATKLQQEMDAWLAAKGEPEYPGPADLAPVAEVYPEDAKPAANAPETPDPDGAVDKIEDGGTLVNVGSTAAPVYQRQE